MKKLLALAVCIFLVLPGAKAQSPSFSTILYNDTFPFQSSGITNAPGGGSVVVGNSMFNGSGLVMRLDSTGHPIWHSFVGTTLSVPHIELREVMSTRDSGYVVAGNFNDILAFFRFNDNGDTIWTRTLDIPGFWGKGYSLERTFDNGILFAGKAYNNIPPYGWAVAALFDSAGTLQWSHVMTDSTYTQKVTARQVPDSGFIVQLSSSYCTLAKLSSSGSLLWSKTYSDTASSSSSGSSIAVASDGFLVMNYMYYKCAVFKTDWNGNVIWCTMDSSFMPFGVVNNGDGPVIQVCHDGGFALLHCNGFGSELVRMDSTGNFLWASDIATVASDFVITADSNYLVSGSGPMWSVRPVSLPIIVPSVNTLKLDSLGLGTACTDADTLLNLHADTIVATPITLTSFFAGTIGYAPIPYAPVYLIFDTGCVGMSAGILEQTLDDGISVYPVPATGSITVSSEINLSRQALCKVFDLSGRELISVSAQGTQFQVSLEKLHEGMYLLVIFDERGTASKKIIKQ